ncbi:hypothetical protein GDO86_005989, partial [Hymenochirus boettgeri]
IGKESSQLKDTGSQNVAPGETFNSKKQASLFHKVVSELPSTAPNFSGTQTLPTRKKPPSLKQLNTARKRLRSHSIPVVSERLAEPSASFPISTEKIQEVKDILSESRVARDRIPEFSLWVNRRHSGTLSQFPIQMSPYTPQPSVSQNSDSRKLPFPDINTSMQADEPIGIRYMDNDLNAGEENQETTTSTIITTTVITTDQNPVQCSVNFYEPEGYIDSTDYPPLPSQNYLECTYNITVYMGYGVELQKNYTPTTTPPPLKSTQDEDLKH